MTVNSLFSHRRKKLQTLREARAQAGAASPEQKREGRPQVCCPRCRENADKETVKQNQKICPFCGYYYPLSPRERIRLIADEGSFQELHRRTMGKNPLDFPGYEDKLAEQRKKTGQVEAVLTGTVGIGGILTAAGVLDSRFLMGSMGTAVGEKITALIEYAGAKKLPLVIFSASGGARMQEGLFALMQMAKTAAAVERFRENGGLYLSCLTHPTTGGVSASFAGLGDILLAEPEALIGFAGPRVIQQTIGQKLPEGFQRSEFLLEHGMLDAIVARQELQPTLHRLLKLHGY